MIKLININQKPYGCLRNDWEDFGIPCVNRLVYINVLNNDIFKTTRPENIQQVYEKYLYDLKNTTIINSLRYCITEKINKCETFLNNLLDTENSRIVYKSQNVLLSKIYGDILTDIKFDYLSKNKKKDDKSAFKKFIALKGLEYAFRFENLENYINLKNFSELIKSLVDKYGKEKIYSSYNPDLIVNINAKINSDNIVTVKDAIKYIRYSKYKEIININNNYKKTIIFDFFVEKMEIKYKKLFNVNTNISDDIKNLFLDLDFKVKSELINKVYLLYENGKIKIPDKKIKHLYFPSTEEIKEFSYYNNKQSNNNNNPQENTIEINENSILSPANTSCELTEYKFPSISYNMLFNYAKKMLYDYSDNYILSIFFENGSFKDLNILENVVVDLIEKFYKEKEEIFYKKFLEDKFMDDNFKYLLQSSLFDFEYISNNELEKKTTESFFFFMRHEFIKNSFINIIVDQTYNKITSDFFILNWKHRKISYLCFCIESFKKYMMFKKSGFVLTFNHIKKLIFSLFPCYKNFKIIHEKHYMSNFTKKLTKNLFPDFNDLNTLNVFIINCVEYSLYNLIKIIKTKNIYALKFAIYQCENFSNTKNFDINNIFKNIINILYDNNLILGTKISRYEIQFASSLINFKNRFDWLDIYSAENSKIESPKQNSIINDIIIGEEFNKTDEDEYETDDDNNSKEYDSDEDENGENGEKEENEYESNDDFYGISNKDIDCKDIFEQEINFTNNNIFNILNILNYYN